MLYGFELDFVLLDIINKFGLFFFKFNYLFLKLTLGFICNFDIVENLLNFDFVDVDSFLGLGQFLLVFLLIKQNRLLLFLH